MKLSELKIDAAKVEAGAWVRDIPDAGDLALRVRGIGNADWRGLSAKLYDAVPRARRAAGRLDPEDQRRIENQCLVATCLLDWDGLTDEAGKPIPYSAKMAAELINDPNCAPFRAAVLYAAGVVANEGVESLDDARKN